MARSPKPPHIPDGHCLFTVYVCSLLFSDKVREANVYCLVQCYVCSLYIHVYVLLFSDKVREANGCCLVQCLAGISRLPTLAIAYMKHLHMPSDDTYRFVTVQIVINFVPAKYYIHILSPNKGD